MPKTLVPFDVADTFSVSAALFERIVEATNTVALKNKWFFASDKKDVIREIAEAGERGAKSFARDFAPPGFLYRPVIRFVLPVTSRRSLCGGSMPVEEMQFRVHINGNTYERLVAAICGNKGF
jgi:hypothetical protein